MITLLEDVERGQKEKLLSVAKRLQPQITPDDLLQPNDFPELEFHPEFRYEEGVLHGIQMVKMAIRAAETEGEQRR